MRDDSVLPDLCASDVLVRTHAVGVNPLDMRVCSFYFNFLNALIQTVDFPISGSEGVANAFYCQDFGILFYVWISWICLH